MLPTASDTTASPTLVEQVYACVALIPPGKVLAYGEVGQLIGTTGRRVGAALSSCPDGIPWHRVVGHDGYLRIAARSPELFREQTERLAREGVMVNDSGKVPMSFFWDLDDAQSAATAPVVAGFKQV